MDLCCNHRTQVPNEDIDPNTGEPDLEDNIRGSQAQETNQNLFASKRSLIHQMVDIALLMANGSQLKALLSTENHRFFHVTMVLICLSIVTQVAFVVCMIVILFIDNKIRELETKIENKTSDQTTGPQERNTRTPAQAFIEEETKKKTILCNRRNILDMTGNMLVLFVVIINLMVFVFGVEDGTKHVDSVRYVYVQNGSVHKLP